MIRGSSPWPPAPSSPPCTHPAQTGHKALAGWEHPPSHRSPSLYHHWRNKGNTGEHKHPLLHRHQGEENTIPQGGKAAPRGERARQGPFPAAPITALGSAPPDRQHGGEGAPSTAPDPPRPLLAPTPPAFRRNERPNPSSTYRRCAPAFRFCRYQRAPQHHATQQIIFCSRPYIDSHSPPSALANQRKPARYLKFFASDLCRFCLS